MLGSFLRPLPLRQKSSRSKDSHAAWRIHHDTLYPPPPPPPLLRAFAAVLLTVLALPASAQNENNIPYADRNSRVLQAAPASVNNLTQSLTGSAPTVQGRTWIGLVQNLQIEVLPGPAGSTTTFGVGSGFKCAHSPGSGQPVEFHNATGTYSRGQPIAIACPTWKAKKCSRSVTFMGRTFTANRGYPRCTGDTEPLNVDGYVGSTPQQQTADTPSTYTPGTPGTYTPGSPPTSIAKTPSNGIFKLRIWGNICINGGSTCRSFKDGAGRTLILNPEVIHLVGYGATFRPANHCGPERWPSEAWRQRNGRSYAEYCDVTVDVRF